MEQWRNDGYRGKYKEIRMKSCSSDNSCSTNAIYSHLNESETPRREFSVKPTVWHVWGDKTFRFKVISQLVTWYFEA